jgi:hypothetical protein
MSRPGSKSLRGWLLAAVLLACGVSQAATITLVPGAGFDDATVVAPEGGNTGTTLGQQRTILFNAAAAIWGSKLESSQTIKIEASFTNLDCDATSGVLGSAGASNFFQLNDGSVTRFFPVALAEALVGNNINGANNEIIARFNARIDLNDPTCLSDTRWYYGLTGPAPGNTIALLPTLLHELGHGLGFQTLLCTTNGGCDFTEPPTPQGAYFSGIPDIWSEFLRDNEGTNTYWVDMSDAQRIDSFTNDPRLVWDGTVLNARIAALGLGGAQLDESRLRMYAPDPFEPGSSLSHFTDDATPNLLMEPSLTPDLFDQTDLTDCLFDDIGWVQNGCGGNTAPVLDTTRSPALAAIGEDAAAPVGAVGTLVSALVDFALPAGQVDNVTDPDPGALLGIAVTGADANGSWFFSTNGGTTWSALGAVAASSARLLAADAATRVYFQPAANFSGAITSALTFRAWDRTVGTAGALANPSPAGGSGAFSLATDTAALTVTAVNDAPVLDASRSPVLSPITEDAPAPAGAVGTPVSALVDFASPAGQLDNVTDPDAGAQLGIAIVGADAGNGSWLFSTNGGTTWSALGSVSASSARLLSASATNRLYFQPDANFNGSITAAITFRAWDTTTGSNGATANPGAGGGTSAFSTASDSASLVVTAVNDAPELDAAASPALAAVLEDAAAPVGAVGTPVSSLVDLDPPAGGLDNVSDVDAAAQTGIAITAADTSNGTWSFSINGGASWAPLGTVMGSNARLLGSDASNRLHFRPAADFNGTVAAALTFRAWDRSSGTAGGLANASSGGGTSAFSSASGTASILVTAVNDAPTLDAIADPPAILQDAGLQVVALTGIGAGGGETQTLSLVAVSSVPGLIPNPTVVYTSPASIGSLQYTPVTGQLGTATITVTLSDDGGAANGGVASTARTFEVEVVTDDFIFENGFESTPP